MGVLCAFGGLLFVLMAVVLFLFVTNRRMEKEHHDKRQLGAKPPSTSEILTSNQLFEPTSEDHISEF